MRFKRVSSEVCIAEEGIVRIGREEVGALKQFLADAPRGRTRLCAHRDVGEALHEMFIALRRGVYIRPHRHLAKSESFHIVEGLVDVVVLDEGGSISDVVVMGDHGSGRAFYYRLSNPYYHTMLIRSELLVVHETTTGPFRKQDTEFASWAPQETDVVAAQEFMESLSRGVDRFVSKSPRRLE